MESAWNFSKSPVPPLRVYMRLGSLYNSLGRTEDAKVSIQSLSGETLFAAPPSGVDTTSKSLGKAAIVVYSTSQIIDYPAVVAPVTKPGIMSHPVEG